MSPLTVAVVAIGGPIGVLVLRAIWRHTIGRVHRAVLHTEHLMQDGISSDLEALKEAMWLHLEGRDDQAKRALAGRISIVDRRAPRLEDQERDS